MKKYYIRFRGTEITTVFNYKEVDTFETECEENLLVFFFEYEIESVNFEAKTCILKKKEVLTPETPTEE